MPNDPLQQSQEEHEVNPGDEELFNPDRWSPYLRDLISKDFLVPGDRFLSMILPVPGFMIRELIPDIGIVLLYGEPKTGKSWIAYDLIRAVATGTPWMERSAPACDGQPFPVLICNYDCNPSELQRRLRRMSIPPDNKVYIHTIGIGPRPLLLPEDTRCLDELIDHHFVKLVVIDSLRQVHGKDENSSQEMAEVTRMLRRLAARTLVVVIHHARKSQGGAVSFRGSGEILAAVDAEIVVTKTNICWRNTRTWAWTDKKNLYKYEVKDAGDKTIVRLMEPVPGLETAESHLMFVRKVMLDAQRGMEPSEIRGRLNTAKIKLSTHDIAAAIRLGEQRGTIVKARAKGQWTNPRRVRPVELPEGA